MFGSQLVVEEFNTPFPICFSHNLFVPLQKTRKMKDFVNDFIEMGLIALYAFYAVTIFCFNRTNVYVHIYKARQINRNIHES